MFLSNIIFRSEYILLCLGVIRDLLYGGLRCEKKKSVVRHNSI